MSAVLVFVSLLCVLSLLLVGVGGSVVRDVAGPVLVLRVVSVLSALLVALGLVYVCIDVVVGIVVVVVGVVVVDVDVAVCAPGIWCCRLGPSFAVFMTFLARSLFADHPTCTLTIHIVLRCWYMSAFISRVGFMSGVDY